MTEDHGSRLLRFVLLRGGNPLKVKVVGATGISRAEPVELEIDYMHILRAQALNAMQPDAPGVGRKRVYGLHVASRWLGWKQVKPCGCEKEKTT